MNDVKTINKQNLQDITLQTKGDIEQLFAVAMINGLAITDVPQGDTLLHIPMENGNKDVLDYYRVKKVVPATSTKLTQTQTPTPHYAAPNYVLQNYWT